MRIIVALFLLVLFCVSLDAQQPTFKDPLLDHLVGDWVLRGNVAGRATVHDIKAEWVIKHQYLLIRETSREKDHQGEPAYAANVYIGWNQLTGEYGLVWLDVFGGLAIESLGHAKPAGDVLAFVFRDLKGNVVFHTTYSYDKAAHTWTMNMDNEQNGKLSSFARTSLTKK